MAFGNHQGRQTGFVRAVPDLDLGASVGEELHDLGVVPVGGTVHRGFAILVKRIDVRAEL
jgi:hypothetical protein